MNTNIPKFDDLEVGDRIYLLRPTTELLVIKKNTRNIVFEYKEGEEVKHYSTDKNNFKNHDFFYDLEYVKFLAKIGYKSYKSVFDNITETYAKIKNVYENYQKYGLLRTEQLVGQITDEDFAKCEDTLSLLKKMLDILEKFPNEQ